MDQLPPEQVDRGSESPPADNPKTVFLIGGAKDVPYDEIIKALNLLHSAGGIGWLDDAANLMTAFCWLER